VTVEHDGRVLKLSMTTAAMCLIEDRYDMSFQRFLSERMETDARVGDVSYLFWAGLNTEHPDIEIGEARAIIDGLGLPAVLELIGQALQKAFPVTKAEKPGPQKRSK